MEVEIIAAVARNGVIGRDGDLPWRLPDDLKQFKQRTLERPIVMGRKTWDSLPGILPRRTHIVITRDRTFGAAGALVAHSLVEALDLAAKSGADKAIVVGGAEIYRAALPLADRLILTHVDVEADGDTVFPEPDWSRWTAVEETRHPADARHPHAFRVVVYERTKAP